MRSVVSERCGRSRLSAPTGLTTLAATGKFTRQRGNCCEYELPPINYWFTTGARQQAGPRASPLGPVPAGHPPREARPAGPPACAAGSAATARVHSLVW